MEIAEIKTYLKENKITYSKLASMTGLSVSTITKIFGGFAKYPRIDTMQAIEKALGLDGGITPEEYEQGARYTKRVSITADEEDILDKSREVIEKYGEKGKDLIIDFCNLLLEKSKK